MNCDDAVALLLSREQLPERSRRQLQRHLAACDACRVQASYLKWVRQQLVSLPEYAAGDAWVSLSDGEPARVAEQRRIIYWSALDTPLGEILVALGEHGLLRTALEQPFNVFNRALAAQGYVLEHKPASSELRAAVAGWLESGEWRGVPLDLSGVSQFQRAVLRGASAIPRGELRTYSELAAEIGKPKAVRAVGNALARNPLPLFIPCHRVVRSSGALGGYAFGLPLKMRLLQYEGALPTRGRAG